jgi:hypothetical protein
MAGKSPVTARDDQRAALKAMAGGADRAEADRARAILLTLARNNLGMRADGRGASSYRMTKCAFPNQPIVPATIEP